MPDVPDVAYITQRVLEMTEVYEKFLKGGCFAAREAKGPPRDDNATYAHLLWLCGEIREAAKSGDLSQCDRNLSFIRGALWQMGYQALSVTEAQPSS